MDPASAAVIQNARDVSQWASGEVVKVDALLAAVRVRPLLPAENEAALLSYRELLVRVSQQNTLMEYALEARRPSWGALIRACLRRRVKKMRTK